MTNLILQPRERTSVETQIVVDMADIGKLLLAAGLIGILLIMALARTLFTLLDNDTLLVLIMISDAIAATGAAVLWYELPDIKLARGGILPEPE